MVQQNLLQHLSDSLPENTAFSLPPCKENPLDIEFDFDHAVENVYTGTKPCLPFANSDVFNAEIVGWRRLTALHEDCKDVYEVTFDVQDSNFNFKAGDTIGLIPHNTGTDVNTVIQHLNLGGQVDCSYKLSVNSAQKVKLPPHIPSKSSLRHVLTHCVDLRCVLKKLFLLALSRHTKEENERKVIEYLCSKEGSTEYQTHILDRNLSLIDLFQTFPSCKPPIQVLLANLPRLMPRPYSIVNSGLAESKLLKICFSVVSNSNRKGLVTGWLEELILNKEQKLENLMSKLNIDCDAKVTKIPIYLRKNMTGFHLPEELKTSLILIGPGTGIAPFIGFLQERQLLKIKHPDVKLGDAWLFFGCRNPDLDFIYEKDLNEFLELGVLKRLCTAFSRVENSEDKYIQDSLIRNSEEISQLIQSDASIFVCGDLNTMAAQVKDTLIQCLVNSGISLEKAKTIINDMQKQKKYVVDAWS